MSFILANWRIALIGALAAGALTFFSAWRSLIEREAVANAFAAQAQADFREAEARVDSINAVFLVSDSIKADSISEAIERTRQAQEQTAAAERARDTAEAILDAQIDSLTASQPDLGAEIAEAVRLEREASSSLIEGLRVQLAATEDQARLWEDRFNGSEEARVATAEALELAEQALDARVVASAGSWTDPLVSGLKYAGFFAAGYALASR